MGQKCLSQIKEWTEKEIFGLAKWIVGKKSLYSTSFSRYPRSTLKTFADEFDRLINKNKMSLLIRQTIDPLPER